MYGSHIFQHSSASKSDFCGLGLVRLYSCQTLLHRYLKLGSSGYRNVPVGYPVYSSKSGDRLMLIRSIAVPHQEAMLR
jgi:hypothetical protein